MLNPIVDAHDPGAMNAFLDGPDETRCCFLVINSTPKKMLPAVMNGIYLLSATGTERRKKTSAKRIRLDRRGYASVGMTFRPRSSYKTSAMSAWFDWPCKSGH